MKNIFLLIAFIVLFSCQKEKNDIEKPFIVGTIDDNSIYNKFDPAIELIAMHPTYIPQGGPGGDLGGVGKMLDVNNDGIFDLKIESAFDSVPGETFRKTGIHVLNPSFEVAFINKEFTFYKLYYFDNGISVISSYTPEHNHFPRPVESDWFIEYRNMVQPVAFKNGPVLMDTLNWNNTYCQMCSRDTGIFISPDILNKYLFDTEAGLNWINAGISYIVFREMKNNQFYYGWVKLEMIGTKGYRIFDTYYEESGHKIN
jgi:hypothetical protein